ncbi:MAG TPA: hypothetical protein VNN10_10260 [Dehalococcoidia bacterium]|nr:hypothetical protein [Dehalococcoidia bacterium]
MVDASLVAEAIRETLVRMPLAASYADEQRDLQPYAQRALEETFQQSFPTANLRTVISVGGTGKPSLSLLGTRFWPDVEIRAGTTAVAAIEVKLIRQGHPASKAIAEAVGQSLIYSIRYPRVFTFVVHYGRSDLRYHDDDAELAKRLSRLNVELILRRTSDRVA